jgi:G8 domain
VQVLVGGVGMALVNDTSSTYFSYLDKWSSLTTWFNNEPPGDGDSVIVPVGQAILVDVSPPRLFLVLVQGEMRFDPTVPEINFEANYFVAVGGKIRIGTEAEPLLNKVTVTLHGNRDDVEIPGLGAKALGVINFNPNLLDRVTEGEVATEPGRVLQEKQLSVMQEMMGASFGQDFGLYGSYVFHNKSSAYDILVQLVSTAPAPNPGAPVPYLYKGIIDIHGAPR